MDMKGVVVKEIIVIKMKSSSLHQKNRKDAFRAFSEI
jgi:hypothetical protein